MKCEDNDSIQYTTNEVDTPILKIAFRQVYKNVGTFGCTSSRSLKVTFFHGVSK